MFVALFKEGIVHELKEFVERVEYIRNQLQEDVAAEQLLFKEYIDPFTGSKNSKA